MVILKARSRPLKKNTADKAENIFGALGTKEPWLDAPDNGSLSIDFL